MPSGQICLGNLVADHPLNRGLIRFYVSPAHLGRRFYDLKNPANNSPVVTFGTWQNTPRSNFKSLQSLSSGIIDLGVLTYITTGAYTYAAYCVPKNYAGDRSLVAWDSSGPYLALKVSTVTTAKIRLVQSGTEYNVSVPSLVEDRWNSLVSTYRNGGSCDAFANGVKTNIVASGPSGNVYFRRLLGGGVASAWNGSVLAIMIWDRALSDSEVVLLDNEMRLGFPDLLRRSPRLMSRVAMFGSAAPEPTFNPAWARAANPSIIIPTW